MRRFLYNTLISAAAVAVVLVALAVMDERVRVRIVSIVNTGGVSSSVGSVGSVVGEVTSVVAMAARDRSLDHGPMVVFVVVAAGLVIGMLKL